MGNSIRTMATVGRLEIEIEAWQREAGETPTARWRVTGPHGDVRTNALLTATNRGDLINQIGSELERDINRAGHSLRALTSSKADARRLITDLARAVASALMPARERLPEGVVASEESTC